MCDSFGKFLYVFFGLSSSPFLSCLLACNAVFVFKFDVNHLPKKGRLLYLTTKVIMVQKVVRAE